MYVALNDWNKRKHVTAKHIQAPLPQREIYFSASVELWCTL